MQFEEYPDWCRICNVHGEQPCVADDGRTEIPDHVGRPVTVRQEITEMWDTGKGE